MGGFSPLPVPEDRKKDAEKCDLTVVLAPQQQLGPNHTTRLQARLVLQQGAPKKPRVRLAHWDGKKRGLADAESPSR